MLGGVARAQSAVEEAKRDEGRALEERKFEFQQKLELEKQNLELQKLDVERRKTWITAGSVAVPLLIGIVTLIAGIVTLVVQSGSTLKLKQREASNAFELKAAEIVMEGGSPQATKGKARALAKLFPESLPKDFGSAFDPSTYGAGYEILLDPKKAGLTSAPPSSSLDQGEGHAERAASADTQPPDLPWPHEQWRNEFDRKNRLFLAHVYQASKQPDQKYDVSIFLMRHVWGRAPNEKTGFQDVEKAEFYFGPSWRGEVFVAQNEGGYIGVSTSAWGTFLAMCRVTFKDKKKDPEILHRYIDFEMA